MKFLAIAVFTVILTVSSARIYERCELARELAGYGFPRHELPDWICLVQSESDFNTRAINHDNSDGSKDWGLFQINDRYWCKGSYRGGKNICGISCEKLLSAGLGYQIDCVRTIFREHGFKGWEGWKAKCRGRHLPSLDHCFSHSAYYFTVEYDNNLPELLMLGNGLDLKFK
uniref:lysozyme n=1 Tax=Phlebotomus papatasi TaxID=29031 RepID=A0A1B0DD83_PHLPP